MKKLSFKLLCKKSIICLTCLLFASMSFSEESISKDVTSEKSVSVKEVSPEQKEIVLTIQDAVDYSLKNSVSIKTAQIDLELAKWKKDTAWNSFIPTVQTTGTFARKNELTPNPLMPVSETESMHWNAMGNLSVSFNFNVAMIQQMRATIASYESGKITWEQALLNNEKTISQLFYGLLLQQESLKLQEDSLENARGRMNQAWTNYRNGYVPQISYLQAQVAYENQVPVVEKLRMQLSQSLDSFAFLIGLPSNSKIKLQGEINPTIITLDVEKLLEKGLSDNLTVRSLDEQLKILKLQANAGDLSCFTPSLALSWNGNPLITNAFDTDWGNSDNWMDQGSFSITLAWNLTNMLPWSTTRSGIKELKDNVSKLEIQRDSMIRKVELDIRTAVDSLKQCEQAINTSKRNIDLAQKYYNLTWNAYQNGTTEYLDLKEAQMQLDQAKLSLLSEKYNYMMSLMDLENILNTKLSGDK